MQDFPLTVSMLLRHGQRVHRRSQVLTYDGTGTKAATFADVAERAGRLAAAMSRLGVGDGDRVATFMWNTSEHLEAYLAVPSMGAVLHTLNVRLFPEQLVHIVNEAADKVILVHSTVLPALAAVADQLKSVSHYVVVDDGAPVGDDVKSALRSVCSYEDILAAEEPGFDWPQLDELQAAVMCYTSGTTGDPKGVVYSHRSTVLHAFATNNCGGLHFTGRDRALIIVPMFHVNAWGYPYTAWMTGCDMVMPARFLQGEALGKLIGSSRPTLSAGVPTIWADLARHAKSNPGVDLSSLKLVVSGGSAMPRSLVEEYDKLGVRMIQGWGMTETSPVCATSEPPAEAAPDDLGWRTKTGRVVPGVELRIVTDSGEEAPWDGTTSGEIQVRGPWITAGYFNDPAPEKFSDSWLRTGDIGTIDDYGFLQISDRLKDVIKSGGEWISSVGLEGEIMAHPEVVEASVIGVPDEKWSERPLAVVVRSEGSSVSAEELRSWLAGRVAKWWVPERWAFVDSIPKTSVGKFDKKVLRTAYAKGAFEVVTAG
ncbi:MAG: long-chain fatty acid--CoA ligase [Acidimicrobiales bacterium]